MIILKLIKFPKTYDGTVCEFLTFNILQNIKNIEGDSLKTLNRFREKCRKIRLEDPFVLSGFVRYKEDEGK